MPSSNRIIIACAGSGKTTRLVKEAIEKPNARIAFLSYTNNNVRVIADRFSQLNSGIPARVDVMTWFGFLLHECARPYQRYKYREHRIESLYFVNQQSARGRPETDVRNHYFANGRHIYSDKLSKFVVNCEKASGGKVCSRLKELYTDIYIDEFQDLAGYDFELIELLLRSGIRLTLVGDPRQHIFSTNPARKNKQYLGVGVINLLRKWQREGICSIDESMSISFRCNQAICDFVNRLWPELAPMQTASIKAQTHSGVFIVHHDSVNKYVREFNPQILRYSKDVDTFGYSALNFGLSKGLEFDHVLIIPTESMQKFLSTGNPQKLSKSKDKLHVAITRASQSVAFVFSGQSPIATRCYGPKEPSLFGEI